MRFCFIILFIAIALSGLNFIIQPIHGKAADQSAKKCQIVASRLADKTLRAKSDRARHSAVNDGLRNELGQVKTKLDGAGFDTTKLQADIDELYQKNIKFYNDNTTYLNQLKELGQVACDTKIDFNQKLDETRKQLKLVHGDALEIREFYANTIRPDILAFKEQIQNKSTNN